MNQEIKHDKCPKCRTWRLPELFLNDKKRKLKTCGVCRERGRNRTQNRTVEQKQKRALQTKKYQEENKEKVALQKKQYREENPEAIRKIRNRSAKTKIKCCCGETGRRDGRKYHMKYRHWIHMKRNFNKVLSELTQ